MVTEINSNGVLVETFGPGQAAIALHESSERRYLVSAPLIANLAPSSFEDADWPGPAGGSNVQRAGARQTRAAQWLADQGVAVSVADARAAVEMCCAIHQSLETGLPVTLR